MTHNTTQQYGTSDLPSILVYPDFLSFDNTKSIKNIFSYIIKHYCDNGLSVLIYRIPSEDDVYIMCGDWRGNKIDLIEENSGHPYFNAAADFLENYAASFLHTMQLIKIEQAQFYFATEGELTLVDMQLSLNKFAGPGMIKDIFGKIMRTQEIIKTEIIDDRAIEFINKGTGSYEGNLIMKPSRFRVYHNQVTGVYTPLYVEVKR